MAADDEWTTILAHIKQYLNHPKECTCDNMVIIETNRHDLPPIHLRSEVANCLCRLATKLGKPLEWEHIKAALPHGKVGAENQDQPTPPIKSAKDIHLRDSIVALSDKMEQGDLCHLAEFTIAILNLIKLVGSATPILEELMGHFHKKLLAASTTRSLEYAKIIRALIKKF